MGLHVITPKCDSCKVCVPLCPTESIFFGQGYYVIDRDTCEDCGICAKVCPIHVIIKIEKPEIEEEEEET